MLSYKLNLCPFVVNFISHFYLERSCKANPYIVVGLALPDLWHTQLNLYAPRHEPNESTALHQFKIGLQKHFIADKIFHNSDYFISMSEWANQEIRKTNTSTQLKRKFFLVHISIELVLDRVLMRIYPDLVEEFYTYFEKVNPEEVQTFMENIYYYNFDGLSERISQFTTQKRLYEYLDDEKLLSLLDWMMQGIAHNAPFSRTDRQKVHQFIMVLEQRIERNYRSLFEEMESKMKEYSKQ